jgi:23S rRNA pseudouridine1911/1915/1917 synthase
MSVPTEIHATLQIPEAAGGRRLDQVLAELLPELSRARLQAWIRDGQVRVDTRIWRPRDKVRGGEAVELHGALPADPRWEAQALELALVHEDEDLIVVNKPPGLVVHPGSGNPDGTLVNALLHHDPDLARLPRAGIVHRIDKDTSGLLVVARSPRAHVALVAQLKEHRVAREYEAVVSGVMTGGGRVDAPVGRHPTRRTLMAVTPSGKPAVTDYRVAERYRAHTRLRVHLHTGRTHQVRVHMAHLRHPLVGDAAYGGRVRLPPAPSPELTDMLRGFRRQALHAGRLSLAHPGTGEEMSWEAPLPDDMAGLAAALRRDAAAGAAP